MSLTKNIGNKIAEARRKVNLSQAQLAEKLFISAQAVGKWERGESMPDITTFDRLAEFLGVDDQTGRMRKNRTGICRKAIGWTQNFPG